MKKISILLLVLAAGLVSACALVITSDPLADGSIVIRLGLDDLATKSVGTADENNVGKLDVFVFSSDGTTQLYHDTPTPTLVDGTHYEQIIHLSNMASGTTGADVKNATVFAIANYPSDGETLTGKTLDQVKAVAVDASNTANAPAGGKFIYALGDGTYQTLVEPSFVMTAEGTFQKEKDNNDKDIAVADLSLKRLAAKLTLSINYVSSLTTTETVTVSGVEREAKKTWTPLYSGEHVRAFLQNAAGNALLGGAYPSTISRFTYGASFFNGESTSKPFYSYPVDISAIAGTDDEPFLKLSQPWEYVTTVDMDGTPTVVDRDVVEFCYKIVLPASVTSLAANTWYQLTVTLKVLGAEASRPPVVIRADAIQILDWRAVGGEGSNCPLGE